VFFSTHTTTPLQVISVRKTYIKSICNTIGPGFQSTSRTTANQCTNFSRAKPVHQNLTDFSSNFRFPEALEFHIHGFHREAPPSSGYTSILVIVDHLSKQSLFIPTHDTITSPQLAQLFILHVFSKHGVPSHITSDCSTKFVSHFFQSSELHWT